MERKKWNLNENNFVNQLADSKSLIAQLQKENKELKVSEEKNQGLINFNSQIPNNRVAKIREQ